MDPEFVKLRRRQLDRRFQQINRQQFEVPISGFLREIRTALGMTATQLAKRLEVTPAAVNKIEHAEANGTITLNSLRKAAEALDCGLVYALIPRTSLEEILAQQARSIAEKEFQKVSKTMALEDQSVDPQTHHRMVDELAQELIEAAKKELWND